MEIAYHKGRRYKTNIAFGSLFGEQVKSMLIRCRFLSKQSALRIF